MAIVRFTLDPNNPPEFTAAERARLDAMTPEEIEANALSDPDNPPLTEDELDRMVSARRVREARRSTGLTQVEFARMFRINHARLRDLERGRSKADSALTAYLKVIEKSPEAVIAVLST